MSLSLVTTKINAKIKHSVILVATVDPDANFVIMSKDIIVKRLKLEIDTKEKRNLRGIVTITTKSLEAVMFSDLIVLRSKLMLILSVTLLDNIIYDLLASRWKLAGNGKEFFIPINIRYT